MEKVINELDSLLLDSENIISTPIFYESEPDDSVNFSSLNYFTFPIDNFSDSYPFEKEKEFINIPDSYNSVSNSYSYCFLNNLPSKKEPIKETEGSMKNTEINEKIFVIKKVKKDKKVGRKRKGDFQKDEKVHSKYDKDNINRKVQVHFLNFLQNFVNEILIKFGFEKRFLNIDYKHKKVVTKNNVESLKKKEIGQILSQNISTKYKNLYQINKEINHKLYLEVIEIETLRKLLSEKYINIFRNIYYKNKRDLNDYGLNIQLSDNVKTYEDLLKKNIEDSDYIEKLNNLVKYCYLSQIVAYN